MKIIISHTNTDFDALASMIAAQKLHPDATVVITPKQSMLVEQFLSIYRDTFKLVIDSTVDWEQVTEMIVVDVASLKRLGNYAAKLELDKVKVSIYDHHPRTENNMVADYEQIEEIGATVTMLIEEIIDKDIAISSLEATLLGLGIYTDTGSFTFPNTTERDLKAVAFLMRAGMNLSLIQQFSVHKLTAEQEELLNTLYLEANTFTRDGLKFLITSCEHDTFIKGLAVVNEKLLEISDADMVLTVVKMKNTVFIVGRVNSDRINLLPLLKKFGGGGHPEAGSASVKKAALSEVLAEIEQSLDLIMKPAITAQDIMATPVKSLSPETKIEEAGRMMYRYGHSGYPVVEDGQLIGMITRRDLDKANHHGLGHAPVKAYMSTNLITATSTTTIEELQSLVIDHNVGRIPIIENDRIVGIVTRTDIIEVMHSQKYTEDLRKPILDNLKDKMHEQFPKDTFNLIQQISSSAKIARIGVYLIGGIVRDLFLNRPNDDIDITVEGDGIAFANQLMRDHGGSVVRHESFGTATWTHPNGEHIDVTSARLEYYARPASLPAVERASLKMDLNRRDFTINSMAICLNPERFGKLVDPFNGQQDLRSKTVRILHNLSFIDDPTRILRAVRFENRFDFKMDSQTLMLAHNSIGRIRDLSADRGIEQMKILFNDKNPSQSMLRLYELRFWKQFGIEDATRERSATHVQRLEEIYPRVFGNDRAIRWLNYFAIPFYQGDRIEDTDEFMMSRRDNKFLQDVRTLLNVKQVPEVDNVGQLQTKLKFYSDEAIIFVAVDQYYEHIDLIVDYLVKRSEFVMFLTGEVLISEGFKPGTTFKKILLDLEVAILNGEVNSRESALKWLHENYRKE